MTYKINCTDILEELIPEASGRFAPLLTENAAEKERIFSCGRIFDRLIGRHDVTGFSAEIDEETARISFEAETKEPADLLTDESFYRLLHRSLSVGISESENGSVLIVFLFEGIWKSAPFLGDIR